MAVAGIPLLDGRTMPAQPSTTKSRSTRAFKARLAPLKSKAAWRPLDDVGMGGWGAVKPVTTVSGNTIYRPGLLDEAYDANVDYGHLFAYLFRRFGYPNIGWDDYKEMAAYALTTPRSDMLLFVSPSVGEWPRLSFRFKVTEEAYHRIEVEPRQLWMANLACWIEAQGELPDWMDEWLDGCRARYGARFEAMGAIGDRSDWRLTLQQMLFAKFDVEHSKGDELDAITTLQRKVGAFIGPLYEAFELVEPNPAHRDRDADWNNWLDSDPLKAYYAAADTTLRDLARPVRVRDSAINAVGVVSDKSPQARRAVDEPSVAGYAVGALGNEAPAEVAALQQVVWDLGKGNAKRGIAELLKRAGVSPKDS
ncbi:MAG: hypothetical protein ACREPQ_14170 [Rhodanobacter sp.]